MPAILEKCVSKLLADPNFKPKNGDKKSSAYAVCTASLKKANKMGEDLDSLTADEIIKISEDKSLSDTLSDRAVKLRKQFVYPLTEIKASEDGTLPNEIQIMPIGSWDTVPYGKLEITASDCQEMIDNFKKGVRAGDTLPIDVDHDGKQAVGWMTDLHMKDDGLWAYVEWNNEGKKLLGEKRYKFLSPEFNPEYKDPENSNIELNNVLIAASLVNRPLFKELQPLVASDQLTGKQKGVMLFIETMDLKELLKKKKAGEKLTADEQEYLKAHDKKADEGEPDEDDKKKVEGKKADEGDEEKEESKKAAEPKGITISAAEYNTLKANADRGVEAAEKLEAKEIQEEVSSMIFSEDGNHGHFPPSLTTDLITFYKTLSRTQRRTFSELVGKMPTGKAIFTEYGSGENLTKGQMQDKITIAARELMNKEKEEGRKLTFSDAVKKIVSDSPELQEYTDLNKRKSKE